MAGLRSCALQWRLMIGTFQHTCRGRRCAACAGSAGGRGESHPPAHSAAPAQRAQLTGIGPGVTTHTVCQDGASSWPPCLGAAMRDRPARMQLTNKRCMFSATRPSACRAVAPGLRLLLLTLHGWADRTADMACDAAARLGRPHCGKASRSESTLSRHVTVHRN